LAGSRVQNPDIRPVFQKPTRTGADKEDVSGKSGRMVTLCSSLKHHIIISYRKHLLWRQSTRAYQRLT